jgi:putative transposase
MKFVSYKDMKAVAKDLKSIYTAIDENSASLALLEFGEKWDFRYPTISASWTRHWQEIIPFLQCLEFIKRAIYTTNVIEASNRQVRKVIKTKGSFPNDDAVYKIVYLALQNAMKKWTIVSLEYVILLFRVLIVSLEYVILLFRVLI